MEFQDTIARRHHKHMEIKLNIAKSQVMKWAENQCQKLDQLAKETDADYLGIQARYFALVPEDRRHLLDSDRTDEELCAGITALNAYGAADKNFLLKLYELSEKLGWFPLTRELTDDEWAQIHNP